MGLAPTGKRRLVAAHTRSGHSASDFAVTRNTALTHQREHVWYRSSIDRVPEHPEAQSHSFPTSSWQLAAAIGIFALVGSSGRWEQSR